MPLIKRVFENRGTNDAEGSADSSSTTDSNTNNEYYSDAETEPEESDSDSTVRNTRPKPTRHHSVGIDRQAGQPLAPYGGYTQPHGPSTQVPPGRQHGPNQGPVPEFSANRYPEQNVNYAFGSGGQGNVPPRPTNSNPVNPQLSMPGPWGPSSHSYGGYPTGYSAGYPANYPTSSEYYPPGMHQMHQMHLNPPPPPPQEVPSAVPEATPEADPSPAPDADQDKARLEAQLAVLTAQKERDEREKKLRQELEGKAQQLKEQLEKARQESSREAERARLQGEQDARQKIEEERHAELEKQRQLAKQRIEIESEVKIKLEAENLARIVREETERKQLEEFRSEALESVLDRLDDAMTLPQEKLLGDTEAEKGPAATLTTKPDRELLLAEMKTTIASRLRQSLVLSEPERINDHISLRGRESRSRSRSMSSSRSRSPRHQVECVSVPDTSSSRSLNSSPHGIGSGDWTGDLPHVPDAPRKAYESDEENNDLTNHSGYDDYGDYDSEPGYRPRQYGSRRHYGRGINADYQNNEQQQYEDLIHHVTDAVMDRLRVPNWDDPMHTAPYDEQWGQYYPEMRRRPSSISDYSDSFDERPPRHDVTDIYDNSPHHKEPKRVSRPYKPRHLRGQPIRAVRNTSPPSPGTSLNPLPMSIAERSNISEEGPVAGQPSVFPKLLENNDSVQRDIDSDSDSTNTTDSGSTIFHEASESMTEYSTSQESTEQQDNRKGSSDGGKDETLSVEGTGRFGSQMQLWKGKMPES